jgi:tRNA threonylcarbamoyladenosine biosynthesis protein TsaE
VTRVDSDSPDETAALGERLGRVLEAGDVVALVGELGAGKTAFVQGLARGLEVTSKRVASPTFTIVNEHPGRVPLYHIDLYRLSHADELFEIGFDEYLGGDGVAVVEWFDRFVEAQPAERLEIAIAITGPHSRVLTITPHGARAAACVGRWIG